MTGPIIISIGLILAPTAIANCQTNWTLAVIAFVVIVVANIFGKGMVKIIPILLGIIVSYVVAVITNQVDFSAVTDPNLKLIALAPITIAKFDISAILTIAPIALASMMEHIGDISAISATVGKNFIKDPGLHRTLLGDGLATALAGMFGGPANTTYGENTGVLALTKVYDPKVIQIAAVFAIILSFIPKFAAIVNTIPAAIIGGVSFILYGMISAIGARNLVEGHVDLSQSRNLIIAATILVSALGFNSIGGITFTVAGTPVTLSGLAIASILGILLNAVLPGNTYEFHDEVPDETGVDFKV